MLNILIYQSILHTALNAHDPGHWCLQQDAVQQVLITSLKLWPQSSSQQMTLQEGSWARRTKQTCSSWYQSRRGSACSLLFACLLTFLSSTPGTPPH